MGIWNGRFGQELGARTLAFAMAVVTTAFITTGTAVLFTVAAAPVVPLITA